MSETKPRILLVEDDLSFGKILRDYLNLNGLEVVLHKDGLDGWQAFRHQHFDLCILDVMMPKRDGFELAEQIRQMNEHIPLFFLTSKTQKADVLTGYERGADDYLTKPVDADVLLRKIRAQLKRTQPARQQPAVETVYRLHDFIFHHSTRQLQRGTQQEVLSPKEAELLLLLCQNMNQLVKREDILRLLWKEVNYFTGRSLDVYVARLRKRLQPCSSITLSSVNRAGYLLKVE